jgi:hypothetical protein
VVGILSEREAELGREKEGRRAEREERRATQEENERVGLLSFFIVSRTRRSGLRTNPLYYERGG